ncbi:hypothetical protein B0H17DRAFT_1133767 [Mycena rosella]|uniref:Uncharacterized protein n=1 Tax=Mycena rosella TaxID=1033263 RepID=A0AAD7DGW3_MYCRO|nr:hypothetical protein B0H17DRAFT_1133767 [Mycena rosella]
MLIYNGRLGSLQRLKPTRCGISKSSLRQVSDEKIKPVCGADAAGNGTINTAKDIRTTSQESAVSVKASVNTDEEGANGVRTRTRSRAGRRNSMGNYTAVPSGIKPAKTRRRRRGGKPESSAISDYAGDQADSDLGPHLSTSCGGCAPYSILADAIIFFAAHLDAPGQCDRTPQGPCLDPPSLLHHDSRHAEIQPGENPLQPEIGHSFTCITHSANCYVCVSPFSAVDVIPTTALPLAPTPVNASANIEDFDDDDYPMQLPLPDNGPLLEYIGSDGTLCVPSDRTPTFALPSALPSETAVEDPAVVDPALPSEDPMILDRTPDAASDGLPTDIPISADV